MGEQRLKRGERLDSGGRMSAIQAHNHGVPSPGQPQPGHGHHGHSHAPASFGRAFAIGVALNLAFVVIEAIYGLLADSMALLADAGHNLSDVAGLLIAWGAATLATRKPGGRYTYGLKSSSILAAFLNALLLLVAIGAIAVEAITRFAHPAPVQADTVMVVAAIGIVVNTATALLFMRGRHDDLNIRGAFLHMAADAAVSAGVVIAGWLIAVTGKTWIDPVTSLVIVVVIAVGTWGLLRDSVNMTLHAAPPGTDLVAIETYLRGCDGVVDLHDLHVWPMSTTETALTAHLVLPTGYPGDRFTAMVAHDLMHQFGIGHTTIQIETAEIGICRLAPSCDQRA
jgi:cobalt-zinc-cadmium efflux system protein